MSEVSAATGKLLGLSMLSGIGPATLRKIAALPSFETQSIESLAVLVPALAKALDVGSWDRALEQAEDQVEQASKADARILSPLDPDYPDLLAKTKDDPFLLFVKGTLAPTPEKSVAIIGTREPTPHGRVIAERITQFFVGEGWSVVSGLALGCDAIAHQTAIDAKGHTVAVLAHGLQTIAPTQHRQLADDILASGGALVSEFPFGKGAIPQQFVRRDRTQAGLAQGVVMVQSDLKGGSLHASRAALDYGRWLAVPYPTEKDRAAGEAKVQANLTLAEGSESERMNLLHLKLPGAMSKLVVLRTKDDYRACLASSDLVPAAPDLGGATQPSMF